MGSDQQGDGADIMSVPTACSYEQGSARRAIIDVRDDEVPTKRALPIYAVAHRRRGLSRTGSEEPRAAE
jgi:hypothetical protein